MALRSEDYYRSVKNDLIGSIGRKQWAVSSGVFADLLVAAAGTQSSDLLFQIVPSIVAVVRDVPESVERFRERSAGLEKAAEALAAAGSVAAGKAALRLLEAMADLDCIQTWPLAVAIATKAAAQTQLLPLCSCVFSHALKRQVAVDLPAAVSASALSYVLANSRQWQSIPHLDSLLTVVSQGIAKRQLGPEATQEEFLKLVLTCTRDESDSLKIASLRTAAALARMTDTQNRVETMQAIIPTLAETCLRGDREACEILSSLAAGDPEVQRLLKQRGFAKDLAIFLLRQSVLLPTGLRCIAAAIDTSEESRQEIIDVDEFLSSMLRLLPSSSSELRTALLELLFALSRSTRDLKPALLTEAIPTALDMLLDDEDVKVRTLVLKLLINTILDYQNLNIDISGIVQKVCALVRLPATRQLALMVVQNLTMLDKAEVKQAVFQLLSLPELIAFVRSGSDSERVQSLCIIRNLLYPSVEDVEAILSQVEEDLIRLLEDLTATRTESTLTCALYAVCNIASGGERHKMLVVRSAILEEVIALAHSEVAAVREAAVQVLINLSWKDGFAVETERLQRLRQLRVRETLMEARDELQWLESQLVKSCRNLEVEAGTGETAGDLLTNMGIWSRFNPDVLEHAEVTLIERAGLAFPIERRNSILPSGEFLHAVFCGDASKPVLVLLHGYMGGGMIFVDMLRQLEREFRLVIVDLLGMGRSSRPEFTAQTTDEAEGFFVEALEMFFVAEHLDGFILAGHSFGGYISGCYAVKYPQRVRQLMLISPLGTKLKPVGYNWDEEVRRVKPWGRRVFFRLFGSIFKKKVSPAGLLRKLGPFSGCFVKRYTKRRFPDVEQGTREALNDYLEQMALLPGSGEYALHQVVELGLWAIHPLAEQLAAATVPIVFFYGDHDWMSPEGAVEAAERTQAPVNIEILRNSDHHIYMDNPHELAEAIIANAQNPGQRCDDYSWYRNADIGFR